MIACQFYNRLKSQDSATPQSGAVFTDIDIHVLAVEVRIRFPRRATEHRKNLLANRQLI